MESRDPLARITRHLPRGSFLVGGAVRDAVRGVPPKDFDFLIPQDPFAFGPDLARALDGFFVPLDEDRRIARVVLRGGDDVDLLPIPPGGVIESLAERDFTMNALAQAIDSGEIVDPFNGRADITARRICFVAEKNLDADPLRILRAFRFQAALGFSVDPALLAAIRSRNHLVWSPAPERIAEEWFLLLAATPAGPAIESMSDAGTLTALFPELLPTRGCEQNVFHHLDVFGHSLAALHAIDEIVATPGQHVPPESVELVRDYLARPLVGNRPRAAYLRFVCLLHDIEKPSTKMADADGEIHFYGHEKAGAARTAEICEKLRLANVEIELMRRLVVQHMIFGPGLYEIESNLDRFFYRLFRDFGGDDGLGMLIFSLADRAAGLGPALPADFNEKHKRFVADGILRYIRQKDRIVPPKLIAGEDVMRALNMSPGPEIGRILERVRELQAEGRIQTRDDALRELPEIRRGAG